MTSLVERDVWMTRRPATFVSRPGETAPGNMSVEIRKEMIMLQRVAQ
jgi:hypothetical protein